jgi:hypothetical protein
VSITSQTGGKATRPVIAHWLVALAAVLGAQTAYAQVQFTSTPVTTATVGEAYVYEAVTSGAGNVTITAPFGLPPWLSLSVVGNGTATLSGTPTAPESVSVTLRAQYGVCAVFVFLCPVQTFTITVAAIRNAPPVVVAPGIADGSVQVGTPFTVDVASAFSDPDGDVLTFRATGLPASFTMAGSSISGTPNAVDALLSPYNIAVTADDGRGGLISDSFTLAITQSRPPEVVAPGIPDQSVNENELLSIDVASAFTDPDGDLLTFTAAGLPAGFTILGSAISGVATAATVAGSPYTVTVTASDGRGGSVTDTFSLAAMPLARADVFLAGIAPSPSPATLGASVEWVVTVGNSGPSPSGSVNLGIEFAGAPFALAAHPCTLTAAADRQQLACTVGPIASGATQAVTLTGSASEPGDLYVTAVVEGASVTPVDPNDGNNAAAASSSVAETIVTTPAQAIALSASAADAGDVNGDGFADLVLVARGEPPALLLNIEEPAALDAALVTAGDQRRGLASVPLSFGAEAASHAVAVADFDNDQALDAVVANGPSVSSTVFRGDGNGVMTELATLGSAARDDRAVAVADLNGDGYVDIVVASANGNTLYLNQNGTAFTAAALPARGGAGAAAVVLADVVGSTLADVIFVYGNGPVVRHENLGGGTFGAAVTIDTGPAAAAASADFNGDGRADLVLARATAGPTGLPSNPVYLNDGVGSFIAAAALGATATTAVLTGDVDGDGVSDIVAINAGGAHALFLGDGNGNFTRHSRLLVSRGASGGAIAPIGRGQRADVVLVGPEAVHVFFNDGRGNLGLGDTARPVIQLNGAQEISMELGTAYTDPGATATDDIDGALTPTVAIPVDPAVIGTYTVTYTAIDSAGNAAVPVTRTVHVTALAALGGGGGGAAQLSVIVLLLVALAARRAGRAMRRTAGAKLPQFEVAAQPAVMPSARRSRSTGTGWWDRSGS